MNNIPYLIKEKKWSYIFSSIWMFLEVLLAIDKLLILGFEANGVLSKIQNILPEYVNLIIFPN